MLFTWAPSRLFFIWFCNPFQLQAFWYEVVHGPQRAAAAGGTIFSTYCSTKSPRAPTGIGLPNSACLSGEGRNRWKCNTLEMVAVGSERTSTGLKIEAPQNNAMHECNRKFGSWEAFAIKTSEWNFPLRISLDVKWLSIIALTNPRLLLTLSIYLYRIIVFSTGKITGTVLRAVHVFVNETSVSNICNGCKLCSLVLTDMKAAVQNIHALQMLRAF